LGIAEVGRWSVATQPGLVGVLLAFDSFQFNQGVQFNFGRSNQTDDSAIAGSSLADGVANDNFDGLHSCPLVLQQFNLLPDWTNLNKTLPCF